MADQIKRCIICNNSPKAGNRIIIGDESNVNTIVENGEKKEIVYGVCEDCIGICAQTLLPQPSTIRKVHHEEINSSHDFKPSAVKEFLDKYVIGQSYAQMVLATAIWEHYQAIKYREIHKGDKDNEVEIEKSNILMLGPTGSGKTYIARTIAKFLDVPFAIADATSMTESGYVGKDTDECIKALLEDAKGDVEKAEKGIIFIDEIDKISRRGESMSITKDVGGEGVQQTLLKLIEGSIVDVTPKGQRYHPHAPTTAIDTSNILFIVGGSFEGIEKIIKKRQGAPGIGIGVDVQKNEYDIKELFLDVKVEDFKKFGMLPELLGRLPIIVPLLPLEESDLVEILTKPKNAIIKQYQALMGMNDIEVEFTEEALKAIAQKALARKTGARALRSIIKESMISHTYKIPEMPDLEKMIITEDVINQKGEPQYIKFNPFTKAELEKKKEEKIEEDKEALATAE